jgi:hypothetical protein
MEEHMGPAKQSSAARTRRHRQRLREQGLQRVEFWAFDTRDPKFIAGVRRESDGIKASADEREVLDWIEAAQPEA